MISYFDTSALIKLLLAEDGSDHAWNLWMDSERRVSSHLVYPEARAALAAVRRNGRLSEASHVSAKASLDERYEEIHAVEVAEDLCRRAGNLAERHSLRGYDAVHLASILDIAADDALLVSWDGALSRAAAAEGVAVFP